MKTEYEFRTKAAIRIPAKATGEQLNRRLILFTRER
jgi:hypothetical protein